MSSDETETETSRTSVKQVRRRDKVWRDASLARMWEAVEEYNVSVRKTEMKEKQGNSSYNRLPPLATNSVSVGKAVRFLPKNFYSPTWWLSQHDHVRYDLLSKPERALPDYSQ
jgi:hypothetical protein